jgi:hypothetical protein
MVRFFKPLLWSALGFWALPIRAYDLDALSQRVREGLLIRLRAMPFELSESAAGASGWRRLGFQAARDRAPLGWMSDAPQADAAGYGPWKRNVVTTNFWVGEPPARNGPTNSASAWDKRWEVNFGGFDDPKARHGFFPAAFVPRRNPFYVALPYNDVDSRARYRPEASRVVPWFWERYGQGGSVCKGQWVAIRNRSGRVCYAQWEDVGPFRTAHWQYVFGNERPLPNANGGAGLDVSPAVRDFLGLRGLDITDWRFVRAGAVPPGPWLYYGRDGNRLDVEKVLSDLRALKASSGAGLSGY